METYKKKKRTNKRNKHTNTTRKSDTKETTSYSGTLITTVSRRRNDSTKKASLQCISIQSTPILSGRFLSTRITARCRCAVLHSTEVVPSHRRWSRGISFSRVRHPFVHSRADSAHIQTVNSMTNRPALVNFNRRFVFRATVPLNCATNQRRRRPLTALCHYCSGNNRHSHHHHNNNSNHSLSAQFLSPRSQSNQTLAYPVTIGPLF